jgi:uncharacterized protein YjbI with pentapeptide repeats
MKIIKPLSLGLLYKVYQQSKANHLVVTALGFFPLGRPVPDRFMVEATQWGKVLSVLPAGQALDEVMPKSTGEAMVLGRACAPGGQAVQQMAVRLQVGCIDKRLRVFGDRQWRYGVMPLFGITPPASFVNMPLDYAHAFGGSDYADNPVGRGYNGNRLAALVGANQGTMPNVEYADAPVNCHTRHFAPAGLGPMSIDWAPRKRYAGTYDQRWLREDYPGLPPDLDWRLYNQAATDQRMAGGFKGGESYLLQGMHPLQQELRGELPDQRVRAFALKQGEDAAALAEISLQLDTVWFLPEQELGVAAYRGKMPVTDSDALDIHALMLAYESGAQAPRSQTYYAQVLGLRLDPKTAGLHAFNESQLASAQTPIAPELLQAHAEAALQKKQAVLDEMSQEFWRQSGMERPAGYQPPKASPPLLQTPSPQAVADGDMDLTALMQSVEQLLAKTRQDAAAHKAELTQQLGDLHSMLSQTRPTPKTAGEASTPARPAWPEVFLRAQGCAESQTLEMLAMAISSPAQAPAVVTEKAAAAVRLKVKARQASPTPLPPAQKLAPEVAARLGAQVLAWVGQGVSLVGRDLAGADLRGACLAGQDLSDCLLEFADLSQADLRGCDLRRAVLTQARLTGALLDEAHLDEANLCGSQAQGASFRGAGLRAVRATGANWKQADGSGCDLTSAQLDGADLSGSLFDGARLDGTMLNQTVLCHSRWRAAQFNKCVGWKMLATRADFSQSHWERSALIGSDLTASIWLGARLTQVQCSDSIWRDADLSGLRAERGSWTKSQLQGANLSGAWLSSCDMSRADLSGARLDAACLPKTLMMQAQMANASAVGTDFFQALLRKADFTGADLRNASLYEAELTEVCLAHADTQGVLLDSRRTLA